MAVLTEPGRSGTAAAQAGSPTDHLHSADSGNSPETNCHESVVTFRNVSFSYENKRIIEDLNFSIQQRDFVGLVGSNGAGKTTLLKMLVGLLKPTSGEICMFNRQISQFNQWERIGYVPQKNNINPLFPATVKEVVLSGLYGRKKMFRRITKEDLQKCEDAMSVMGIEDLAGNQIGRLSGGQQQRAFLARSLVNNPELLILDEPTAGIDEETQMSFYHMIQHMHRHHHITFLMVSHDLDMLQSYLGSEPLYQSGKLKFFVKHSHEIEDCDERNLTHTMADLRRNLNADKERIAGGHLA
ncbi:metal ABC transporter ATP-binding protein [Ferviditalea candida]|uniref:Metal ABC transporter ATP-binding protein n=1 Tax=Ferviditalea candida TaxID=3108399 RepID=A0ABU5ZGV2_9BACL|nr:metal ABC transporter ATP-binding protein [Paenibacillaceae bacterium T2]